VAAAYTVFLAAEAAAEVLAIVAWWRKNRPAAPSLLQDELKQALLNIAARPGIGARAKMRGEPDVRAVVLRKSRYVYDVDDDAAEIEVVRVRHGKRRPLKKR
jgi:plasmid stabilization system protein ParE